MNWRRILFLWTAMWLELMGEDVLARALRGVEIPEGIDGGGFRYYWKDQHGNYHIQILTFHRIVEGWPRGLPEPEGDEEIRETGVLYEVSMQLEESPATYRSISPGPYFEKGCSIKQLREEM